jgi:cytochrome c556
MNPGDIISAGGSLGGMSVAALLGVAVMALSVVSVWLWRDGRSNSKEAANTYIALLKEQFSDANRRKDLFEEFGKSIESLTGVVREQRLDLSAVRQELANLRAEMQRLRP